MSDTLVTDRDVIVYRNEESYSHNAVVELLRNGEMVCCVQEQTRRKYRTHYDPTSRAVLLRSRDNGSTWDPATRTVIAEAESEAVVDPGIRAAQGRHVDRHLLQVAHLCCRVQRWIVGRGECKIRGTA